MVRMFGRDRRARCRRLKEFYCDRTNSARNLRRGRERDDDDDELTNGRVLVVNCGF